MSDALQQLLKRYWKADEFRPQQREICESVLSKKDNLVLLSTGGGKSLCYQLPALLLQGPTLVISPLISLMQDQVAQANSRGIKSMALGNQQQLDQQLDNAAYGNYSLVYCSPEKLQNKQLIARLTQLNIQCIAVDEAHCISQWGNDFRPAFLQIKNLRKHLPLVPIVALTATATPQVVKDIAEGLELKNYSFFQSSFARNNISLQLNQNSDKFGCIFQTLKDEKTASIIYCSSRRETQTVEQFLNSKGLKAAFFHGGLSENEKKDRLLAWQKNLIPIMVATNAFGMGIDKEDVGVVIHLNLPASLEYYYQEIGRAGRGGKSAKAVLLYHPQDAERVRQQFLNQLPTKAQLNQCYKSLCNYLNIGLGEGFEQSWELSFSDFCSTYNYNPKQIASCLQLFDQAGIFQQHHSNRLEAKLHFICSINLFKREIEGAKASASILLQTIARQYPGIFEQEIAVDLDRIAQKSKLPFTTVVGILEQYHKQELIHFSYANFDLKLTGLTPREDEYSLRTLIQDVKALHKIKEEKINAIIAFANNNDDCKQKQLLAYFGEQSAENCGQCSSKSCCTTTQANLQSIKEEIFILLSDKPLSAQELKLSLGAVNTNHLGSLLEELEATKQIKKNTFDQFYLA